MKGNNKRGSLRIVGGRWRGRRLTLAKAPELRPTSDRIRETLFNWLAPHIRDARCLDLYAGSGALGLEALSRSASSCDFVEQDPRCGEQLLDHIQSLDCERRCSCTQAMAKEYLKNYRGSAWDVIFLDPPFGRSMIEESLDQLIEQALLAPDTLVYLEYGRREQVGWNKYLTCLKQKETGDVAYGLFQLR
ncbi:MAG: 16S rRNA (guanine(966)-N(2))-methyltransferase RsmD [Pseudomonadota bacterium]